MPDTPPPPPPAAPGPYPTRDEGPGETGSPADRPGHGPQVPQSQVPQSQVPTEPVQHLGPVQPGPDPAAGGDHRFRRQVSRATAATARATGHVTALTARATGRGARGTFRLARRASQAHGAADTGLDRLIGMHFFSMMGDTLVALALAGTVFFSMPSDGASSRAQVALFLGLTLLPFTFIAPLVGPLLDRFRHARRWAIGGMHGVRAILAIVLANALGGLSLTQFFATLGVLVASKAYNVSRIAAAARLVPDQLTPVKANGRMSMAGVLGATLGAPVGVGLGYLGGHWTLYGACAAFVVATALAVLLPDAVDATRGAASQEEGEPAPILPRSRSVAIPRQVRTGFQVNAGLRALSGFLMIFMAFAMIQHPFPGWEQRSTLLLAIVVACLGIGNALGTLAAALLRTRAPQPTLIGVLLADAAAAVLCAARYELWTVVVLAVVAGAAQQMGKLALDALIQRTIPEEVHTSVFGRSETVLQLAFVVGAFIGLLPVAGNVGMGLAAVLLVVWTLLVLIRRGQGIAPVLRSSALTKDEASPPPVPAGSSAVAPGTDTPPPAPDRPAAPPPPAGTAPSPPPVKTSRWGKQRRTVYHAPEPEAPTPAPTTPPPPARPQPPFVMLPPRQDLPAPGVEDPYDERF